SKRQGCNMNQIPPLAGLMCDLRNDNKRFAHLSELLMKNKLADFQKEYNEKDQLLDEYSQVTLLHMAVSSGSAETITYILQLGLDINSLDKDGNTPLHFA